MWAIGPNGIIVLALTGEDSGGSLGIVEGFTAGERICQDRHGGILAIGVVQREGVNGEDGGRKGLGVRQAISLWQRPLLEKRVLLRKDLGFDLVHGRCVGDGIDKVWYGPPNMAGLDATHDVDFVTLRVVRQGLNQV